MKNTFIYAWILYVSLGDLLLLPCNRNAYMDNGFPCEQIRCEPLGLVLVLLYNHTDHTGAECLHESILYATLGSVHGMFQSHIDYKDAEFCSG